MIVQVYEEKKKGRDLECNFFLSPASYIYLTRKDYIDNLSDKPWEIVMGELCSFKFGYLHPTFLP